MKVLSKCRSNAIAHWYSSTIKDMILVGYAATDEPPMISGVLEHNAERVEKGRTSVSRKTKLDKDNSESYSGFVHGFFSTDPVLE